MPGTTPGVQKACKIIISKIPQKTKVACLFYGEYSIHDLKIIGRSMKHAH